MMTSFNINTKAHSSVRRQNKIASMKNSPNENERAIANKKLRPSMNVNLPSIRKEDIKLVDMIIGEEKCGKGMYWCNTDKKCKKISMTNGGDIGTNKGEIEEDVTIEDAFGNKFVEFVDLIKPESLISQREEKDHEISMAHKQINKSQENLRKVKKNIGKKEKNLPAWMQAKLTDTEHNTDAVAGYSTKEGMDLAKADMGDVIKDFRKSKKPQFKGKSDKKIRQMAIAAKLEAERQNNEEVDLEEAVRLPSEFGHLLSVIVTWRGNTQYLKMFFPQSKLPKRSEIQSEIEKVYPGGRVVQYSTSDLPSNYGNFDSPLFKVTKEEVEIEESCCKKCKKSPCKCSKSNDMKIEEKKGLWDNIHARRKAGKPKRKPGDENYPETLNVEGKMATARANVGASKCWDGYKAKGTKKKNGKVVPNCVPEENEIEEGKTPITRQAGDFKYPGKTGEEKGLPKANRLSKSENPTDRRRGNKMRSRLKTAADRDTAQASSDARQELYRRQQRRANDLAQQLMKKESVNEDINISGGNVGTIVIGGDLPKK